MLTQHCAALKPGESCYTAAVTVKGKLFGTMYLHSRAMGEGQAAESLLVIPSQTAREFVEHLDKHIIMEEVELALLDDHSVLTVQGPRASELSRQHLHSTEALGPLAADRLGLGDGCDWLVQTAQRDAISAQLASESARVDGLRQLNLSAWEELRLAKGLPAFMQDFSTDNYVQEADITAQTVSFSKGCYIGQEVVCRLEMRGHVRRQLVHLSAPVREPFAPGTPLDHDAGTITSSAFVSDEDKVHAIAMVKWDLAKEQKPLFVNGVELTHVVRG